MNNKTLITTLRTIGVLNLIGSFIAALYFWSNAKTPQPGYRYLTETNPMMIALGIAVVVEALILYVAFYGLAAILEEVMIIKGRIPPPEKP
jgi:hypothetical protein